MEKLLTSEELAKILDVRVTTVRNLAAQGKIPSPLRIGRRALRWRASDIEAFLQGRWQPEGERYHG